MNILLWLRRLHFWFMRFVYTSSNHEMVAANLTPTNSVHFEILVNGYVCAINYHALLPKSTDQLNTTENVRQVPIVAALVDLLREIPLDRSGNIGHDLRIRLYRQNIHIWKTADKNFVLYTTKGLVRFTTAS